jgi:hypothetical protein
MERKEMFLLMDRRYDDHNVYEVYAHHIVGNGCLVKTVLGKMAVVGTTAISESLAFMPGVGIVEFKGEDGGIVRREFYSYSDPRYQE